MFMTIIIVLQLNTLTFIKNIKSKKKKPQLQVVCFNLFFKTKTRFSQIIKNVKIILFNKILIFLFVLFEYFHLKLVMMRMNFNLFLTFLFKYLQYVIRGFRLCWLTKPGSK